MAIDLDQTAIPYVFMRGGTSRGPYFKRDDLPEDLETLSKVLVAVVGSGHSLNIDGIGGGVAVTTKVAMLSKSKDKWADIDYFFAQVSVEDKQVDYKPTCGNILSGVGPAAIELGLLKAQDTLTEVRIRAVNTGARVVASLQINNNMPCYQGTTVIAGVPGSAAAIPLNFIGIVGGATGRLLPTGQVRNVINGVEVTCLDVAMPLVIAHAESFGLSGYESTQQLEDNREFFECMESIRQEAGKKMGMGDVAHSVTPKFAIIAKPQQHGTIAARYFMPWSTHPSFAVTGAQCLATCTLIEGSIADGLAKRADRSPTKIIIEHPSGTIEVNIHFSNNPFKLESAGLVRTARKIADGCVYVPSSIWKRRNYENSYS